MFTIETTEHHLGVTISGEYGDFDKLYDAIHHTIGEAEPESPVERLLGLAYDLRHAMMNNRELINVDNGVNDEMIKYKQMVLPKHNVHMAFNVLYPEFIFQMMILNEVVKRYAQGQSGAYDVFTDKHNIWDENIAVIRLFQSVGMKCIKKSVKETLYSRILKHMTYAYNNMTFFYTQYLDKTNIEFIHLAPEKRLGKLSIITKRFSERDGDYVELKRDVDNAAAHYKCSRYQLTYKDDYPEDYVW